MKKYTILDSTGQKKIVYAPNMKKALRYVGDGEKTTVKDSKFYVILSNYDYTKAQAEKDARKYGLKLQILGPANGSKQETEAYLVGPRANIVRMLKETNMDEFEGDIEDSKVKDEDDYFYFDADEDDRSLDDYKRIMKQCGLTITKVEGNNREAFIYYRGSSSAEQKAARMLGISLEDSVKDSKVKDAGLKTYKTLDYYAENGYYKVYVKNRNKNGDQPIKHLAETLGLKTSPQGYFTKDRVYAPPYAKEYLVEGTNKDAIIKFCETLDPELAPLKGHIKDADTLEGEYHTKYGDKLIVSKIDASTYSYFDVDTKHVIRVSINALKEDIKAKRLIKDSKVKDADANIVDKLIVEEEKAVMDYKEALMADSDLSANAVYSHILAEELEHLRELRSLKEQPSLGDSIKDAVQTAETYANTGWIEKLASDLLNEGQKNGYDFDAVLKKFDSLSKQILVIVKNALDKAKKEIVDYKSRY